MKLYFRGAIVFLFFAALIASPNSAIAATKVKKPLKHATNAADLSSSTVSGAGRLSLSSAPLHDVADVLVHFEAIDNELKSMSANFTENITMSESNIAQKVSGTIAYQKPNRLRLEYTLPEPQTVVSDGKTIWIYRKAHNQVIDSKLDDWKKSDPLMDNLLSSVGSYTTLLKRYTVSFDSATCFVTLSPKEGTGNFILRLRLTGPEQFPRETELTVAEMRVDTAFDNIRFNPKLSTQEFLFSPPAEAEVFHNFKPPQRTTEGSK